MASTPSTSLRLELIGSGDQAGTWGNATNVNLGTLLEQAICGYTIVPVSDITDTTLTAYTWSPDQARSAVINLTGTLTATRNVIAPAVPKIYIVKNSTTGGQAILFKTSVSTGISIPNSKTALLYFNGVSFEQITPYYTDSAGTATNLTGNQTNYATLGRTGTVANMLGWKNFGDGYVIFDASNATAPNGTVVSNTNPTTAWIATYPTLMGWNGASTYGVRVDSARTAEKAQANTFNIDFGGVAAANFQTLSANILRLSTGAAAGSYYFNADGYFSVIGGTGAAVSLVANTTIATLDSVGIRTNGALGYYGAGTGGTITQVTSKATAVTLHKICGTITTSAASLAASTAVSFSFSNSTIASTDNIILNIVGGTIGAYCLGMDAIANGSCIITLRNLTAAAIAEAVSIRFTVLKAVNS